MSKNSRSALTSIRANYSSLSQSERSVADYVIENAEEVSEMSMMEIANNTSLSDATVLRFVRSIGFTGFSDFKIALAVDMLRPTEAIFEEIDEHDNMGTVTTKVFQSGITLLQDTLEHLDMDAMKQALDLTRKAGRIYLFATGTSAGLADWYYTRLMRLNYNVVMNTDSHLQLVQASLMSETDLIIMITRSGTADNLIRAQSLARKNNVKVVCITCNAKSPVALNANVSLTGVAKELHRDISGSPISMLGIIDALYTNLELDNLDRTVKYQKKIWEALKSSRKKT